MQNIKEYKLKENVSLKLYSNVETYKKMFIMMLDHSYEEAEKERKNGTITKFEDFVVKLYEEFGIKDDSI